MKVEVGFVTGHPISVAFGQFMSVIRTWRYCKKHGLPFDKWYGVYEQGQNRAVAHMGCMPQAHWRASMLAEAMQESMKHSQRTGHMGNVNGLGCDLDVP